MRTVIFLVGVMMVILGPLITLTAFSSCVGTILSGHFFACVTDFGFIVFGGVLFVVGIVVSIVGAIVPDGPSVSSPNQGPVTSAQLTHVTCKKCGRVYDSDHFFCPSCGQRPS